jgi:hypothetical protein
MCGPWLCAIWLALDFLCQPDVNQSASKSRTHTIGYTQCLTTHTVTFFLKALQQPGKCVSIKSPIQLTCTKDLTGLSKVLEVVDYNVLYTGYVHEHRGPAYIVSRLVCKVIDLFPSLAAASFRRQASLSIFFLDKYCLILLYTCYSFDGPNFALSHSPTLF